MNFQHARPARRMIIALATATALTLGAPAASADLGTVAIGGGETQSVELGVPLGLNTVQDGFTIVSYGTSVSVTAPTYPSTTTVTVSYGGMTESVTLTTDGQAGTGDDIPSSVEEALEEGALEQQEGAPADTPAGHVAPRPPREAAPTFDESEAKQIELTGSIEGNVLRARMGLTQATNLYSEFKAADTEGLSMVYVDGDGNRIQDVSREINKESRTLTLTYPEDQTPDNPFIIKVVREADNTAIATVTITSPGQLTTVGGGEADVSPGSESKDQLWIGMGVVGAVLVLLLLVGGVMAAFGRKTKRR